MKSLFLCLILNTLIVDSPATDLPPIQHRFLAVDESRSQLLYVDQKNPMQDWTLKLPVKSRDYQLIGHHQILLSGNDGYYVYDLQTRGLVKELHNATFAGTAAVRRLPNGNTVIGCNGPNQKGIRFYELGPDDRLIKTAEFPQLNHMRLMRLSSKGSLLFGAGSDVSAAADLVIEADLSGKILAQFNLPPPAKHVYQVLQLANGNLLAAGGYGHYLAEIDPSGAIVPRKASQELPPEIQPHFWAGFQILKNGNLLQCNWTGHGPQDSIKGAQLVEFNPAGNVVWSWHDPQRAGSIHGVIVLDDLNPEVLNDDRSGILQPLANR